MSRILFWVVVVIIAWFGYQFASAMYDEVQVKELVTETIVEHRTDQNDHGLIYDIQKKMLTMGSIQIASKNIIVKRSNNNKSISVKLTYTQTIHIPVINKNWVLHFSPEISPPPLSF